MQHQLGFCVVRRAGGGDNKKKGPLMTPRALTAPHTHQAKHGSQRPGRISSRAHVSPSAAAQEKRRLMSQPRGRHLRGETLLVWRHRGQRQPSCGVHLNPADSCFGASGSERKQGGAETPSTPHHQKKKEKISGIKVNLHT